MSDELKDMFDADARVDVTDDDLGRVRKLARDLLNVQATIANLETQLKTQKDAEKQLSEIDIPTAMSEIGLTDFRLDTGERVEIKSGVRASIPEKYRDAAFKWLRDNNLGSIIKNKVVAMFGRGEDSAATALVDELKKDGRNVEQDISVPWNTLTAVVKERREQGLPTPDDILGVYEFKSTKISSPKSSSKK
jgi:hypothetical protein